jgi:hypothetical protein
VQIELGDFEWFERGAHVDIRAPRKIVPSPELCESDA